MQHSMNVLWDLIVTSFSEIFSSDRYFVKASTDKQRRTVFESHKVKNGVLENPLFICTLFRYVNPYHHQVNIYWQTYKYKNKNFKLIWRINEVIIGLSKRSGKTGLIYLVSKAVKKKYLPIYIYIYKLSSLFLL